MGRQTDLSNAQVGLFPRQEDRVESRAGIAPNVVEALQVVYKVINALVDRFESVWADVESGASRDEWEQCMMDVVTLDIVF